MGRGAPDGAAVNRPPSEMATLLSAMADMKQLWIGGHTDGKDKRPEWVIALAKRDLSVLRQAAAEYQKMANDA
jgi:hypothetical protein